MMLTRPTIFWKALLAVAMVAVLSAGVAISVHSAGEPWWLVVGLSGLFIAVGSAVVAAWVVAPVRQLLAWVATEESRRLRFATGDEWQTVAVLLTAWRREARRRVAESGAERDRLRAVLATMADGVLMVDAARRIELANAAASAMLGLREDEAVGRTIIEGTISADLDDAVGAALERGGAHTADLDLLYPQPRRIRAFVSASGEGADRAAVVVLQDQTDAHRLDQIRRDFVANVSHELRTPVTGIQTLAESLLEGGADDPNIARQFLEHIHASSRRLVALVDDLLSLARAETRTPAERVPVALAPVARAVVAALDPLISEKRLDVGVDIPEGLSAWGDAESLRQVLSNLVDNAVKYTPEGGSVEVSAGREGETIRVLVTDTGIGIPAEHQGRVFERFYRVDRARSRAVGGTGLGLSIVKHLVEGMGGQVSVQSAPGHGSTFTVSFPAPPAVLSADGPEKTAAPEQAAGPDLTIP